MNNILSGLRVIESSAFVAVPMAGMTLSQMGAEVIRFDRLEGGLDARRMPYSPSGTSLFWSGMNKGKKSIAVDMKSPKGKELISNLVTAPGKDAGLFLTNLKVRGWLDYETLSKVRSDIIIVTLTGDRHGRPQVDYTVNPALGIPDITGHEGSADPVANAIPAWDMIAGNMCVSSLLAAERYRLRHGVGQDVEIALKDVAAAAIGHLGMIADATLNSDDRTKAGNALYGAYGKDFLCADGNRVMIIGLTSRQWSGIVKATDTSEQFKKLEIENNINLQDESIRWQWRHAITEIIEPWFKIRAVEDFADDFDKTGLTWSVFRSVKEALNVDPDLTEDNPLFKKILQPDAGEFLVPKHPANFSKVENSDATPAPALGEHTEEVLGDVLNLSDLEIANLFDDGVVASSNYNKN
ncbi:MAG: 2-methylfumaryl-CoA isomerase [Rhodobacteraceae bacterium]|jgi:2-methylfumaryl-CoA isomerase|nr:2-methylfumaryl-CoA isomerase [Paracoccaceae bacterium]|tara:strand:+ start:875 stop:2104 length:1230 start_codon:yes stop_codon:yes gene_type:complete